MNNVRHICGGRRCKIIYTELNDILYSYKKAYKVKGKKILSKIKRDLDNNGFAGTYDDNELIYQMKNI